MTVLSSEQRKLLSDVVVRAREVVEAACAQRVSALGVAEDKLPNGLSIEERAVRVGLRARARQLGSVDALVTEAGFEHWHRMLFARFLADNQLLVDDQFGQPLSIDEVAEFAAETGESDKWEVAARFAAAMLPGIFIQNDPILNMRLPVETRQELEGLLDRLPVEVITAEDSLGWIYQYWQAKRKDEVNKSERKIGGADLAPVTQLFTENYMVRFLLENSLGAWWADRHPDSPLLTGWEYLRRDDDGSPAAGGFDGWPQRVAEVSVMDPCCGSGHFLVAAFGMLWRMRAEEEHLEPAEAQDAVLRDNLFGLELDPRCTQIAMFALALEAWKAGGHRDLPLPNVACCGIPTRAPLSDWLDLAGGEPQVEAALTRLHALFANADTLGSLIDPVRAAEQAGLESVDWHTVAPLVKAALTYENSRASDLAAAVFGQAAVGIARTADYLSRTYVLVVTNPPYLTRQHQRADLTAFLETNTIAGDADIATAFLERGQALCGLNGATAMVSPLGWFYQPAYRTLREHLLTTTDWKLIARLGSRAFRAIGGEVVTVSLTVLAAQPPFGKDLFAAVDAMEGAGPDEKEFILKTAPISRLSQKKMLTSPSSRVTLSEQLSHPLFLQRALSRTGTRTSDNPRLLHMHWEHPGSPAWRHLQSVPSVPDLFAGREQVLLWQGGTGVMANLAESGHASIQGMDAWGKKGVCLGLTGNLKATLYLGEVFDMNAGVVWPKKDHELPALWAYCSSPEFARDVRVLDQQLKLTTKTLLQVPFDFSRWNAVARELFPEGLPEAFSNDPTQWLFDGRVADSRFPLQVAVARLLGFRWPDQEPAKLDALADSDGVVCLPAVGGESTAEERLRALLAGAYGDAWGAKTLDGLLTEAGGISGLSGLSKWLRDGFFKDHCKTFANRPFIWQIWDGCPDGFSALINYHKLDRKLLERLTYDYLGSWWIGRLNDEVRQEVPGAEARLVAAENLKSKLQLILEGEPPYDLYVRWKSLGEQPLGWDPDLDDGVRINIRPFMTAGVLRAKPNIKWEKDRGKNPDGTERFNDLHYTRAQKETARGGAST